MPAPLMRSASSALSTSPSDSTSAFLQSIIAAPVWSRSAFTSDAVIVAAMISSSSPRWKRSSVFSVSAARLSGLGFCGGASAGCSAAGLWPPLPGSARGHPGRPVHHDHHVRRAAASRGLPSGRLRPRWPPGQFFGLRLACGLGGFALGLLFGLLGALASSSLRRRSASSAFWRLKLCLPLTVTVADHGTEGAEDDLAGTDCVVVARDHVVDRVRVAVGVDQRDDRDAQAVGLLDGDLFGVDVDDDDGVGNAGHVLDATEVGVELRRAP